MSTVEIAATQGLASQVATALVHGRITMVLVLVVSDVLRLRIAFVPAITRCCSPSELERQQGKQSNDEPTTHAKECSGYRVWGEQSIWARWSSEKCSLLSHRGS